MFIILILITGLFFLMLTLLLHYVYPYSGLAHLLTFEAFAEALPENTIHFISGGGRKTLPKLMESGKIGETI